MSCLHLSMLLPVLGPKRRCVAVMRAPSGLPWCVLHLPTLFDTPSGCSCVSESKQMQDHDWLSAEVSGPRDLQHPSPAHLAGKDLGQEGGEDSVTVTQCRPVSRDPASD